MASLSLLASRRIVRASRLALVWLQDSESVRRVWLRGSRCVSAGSRSPTHHRPGLAGTGGLSFGDMSGRDGALPGEQLAVWHPAAALPALQLRLGDREVVGRARL